MNIKDFKKFVSEIPESMEDAELWYVDFSNANDLRLHIGTAGARITGNYDAGNEYIDERLNRLGKV